jgi:hypothetical protein
MADGAHATVKLLAMRLRGGEVRPAALESAAGKAPEQDEDEFEERTTQHVVASQGQQ